MKKITTLIMFLLLTCMGATAQVITTWDTAGDPVTYEEFVNSAGTDKRYLFRMPSISRRAWCDFTKQTGAEANSPSIENLFSIEKSENDENAHVLKRFQDGKYLSGTESSSEWVEKEEATDLYLENRTPDAEMFSDPEDQYPREEMADYYISMDNAEGLHFNNGNFGFRGGRGGWSAYFAYGPFYLVTVNCVDELGNPVQEDPAYYVIKDGEVTVEAPTLFGKVVKGETTATVQGGADREITFVYQDADSFDYDLVIKGAVEGMKLYIKGEEVDINETIYTSIYGIVEEGDVVVIFPEGTEDMSYKVTVTESTITISCFNSRYPINFDRDQTYTHTAGGGRKTTWVALGDQKIEWEFQGVGVEPAYRDMTDQALYLPTGATVTPAIGFEGAWMHGFLYIDYNNDGQFYVEYPDDQTEWSTEPNGELVSYKNIGSVLTTSTRTLPDITLPTEPGTYYMRFKVDWASTDPAGNPGDDPDADPYDINNENHIIKNGGTIIDVMLVVGEGHNVTYKVLDEKGEVLAEKTTQVAGGVTISSVPSDMLMPGFYDYSEVTPVTVESDVTITTTATLKEDPTFKFTADTTDPVWYNLTIRPDNSEQTGYPTYEEDGDPNVTLPNTLVEDATTQWAFIGTNPYKGFQIVNKAAGTNLVLGAENAYNEGIDGEETYATLAEPSTHTYETWMVEASTHAPNGFFLYNTFEDTDDEGNPITKRQYLNRRDEANLAYYTGGHDIGSTFVASKPRSGEDMLAEAQHLLEELTAGANEVQIGYPTSEALANFKTAVEIAAEDYKNGNINQAELGAALRDAMDEVKRIENASYEPRTDVYYIISNTRGTIVYNPEKAENVDDNGNEFLWFWDNDGNDKTPVDLTEFDKEDANNLWGVYKQGEDYYLYNVGKVQFANMTQSGSYQGENGNKHSWMFSNKPAKMTFDAGEGDWVPTPAVRIRGTIFVVDEEYPEDEYEETYAMSISPSYRGPVISYDAEGDKGVPMVFTLATTELNEEVTKAIEDLLANPDGIELLDAERTTKNGAIYNLQGQRVNKAVKGVYIQNGRKIVLK